MKALGVLTFVSVLLIAACADIPDDSAPGSAPSQDRGLTVGVLLPQTGDLRAFGIPEAAAITMAADEVNASGGVNGQPVEILVEDDATDEQIAFSKTQQLLDKNVQAIIGPDSSRLTLTVIDSIVTAGVVQCSPAATAPALTAYPDNGLFFRTAASDELQGTALADQVLGDNHKTATILAINDPYGQGLAKAFSKAYRDGGGRIVADVAYDPKGANYDTDTATALAAKPSAIALIALPESGSKIVKALIGSGAGPNKFPIYTTDGLQTASFADLVDPDRPGLVDGMIGTGPPQPTARFLKRIKPYAATATTFTYSEQSFDCMIVTALAAQAAGSNDSTAIASQMVAVTTGGSRCATFARCTALLAQGSDIDYVGASGALDLDATGEPVSARYEIWRFKHGRIVTLGTVEYPRPA